MPIYQGLSPQAYATSDRYVRTPVTKSYYSQPTAPTAPAPATPAVPESPEGFSIEDIDPEILKYLAANMESGGGGGGGDYTDSLPEPERTLADTMIGDTMDPDFGDIGLGIGKKAGLNAGMALAAGAPGSAALQHGLMSALNPQSLGYIALNNIVPSVVSRGIAGRNINKLAESADPLGTNLDKAMALGSFGYPNDPNSIVGSDVSLTGPQAAPIGVGSPQDAGIAMTDQQIGVGTPQDYNKTFNYNKSPDLTRIYDVSTVREMESNLMGGQKYSRSLTDQLSDLASDLLQRAKQTITAPWGKKTITAPTETQPIAESTAQNQNIGLAVGDMGGLSLLDSSDGGGDGGGWDSGSIGIGTDSDVGIAMDGGSIGLGGTTGISLGDFGFDDGGDDYGSMF